MRRALTALLLALLASSAALAETGPRRFLDAIDRLHNADRWQARMEAAVALGTTQDQRAYRHLVSALEDPHFAVRAAAARALVRLQDARAVPHLLAGLTDEEPFVRTEMRKAAARFELDAARPYLVHALRRHRDPRVRMFACERLAERLDSENVEVVLDATGDTPPVGRYAARVLAAMPVERATAAFMTGLRHADYRVQIASMRALADLDAAEATEPLIGKLDARVPEVVVAATESLTALRAHVDGAKYRVNALRAKNRFVRARALKVLGVLGEDEDRRVLMRALDDRDLVVRGAAVAALGNLQELRAIPKLAQMRTQQENARIISSVKATLHKLRQIRDEAGPAESAPTADLSP